MWAYLAGERGQDLEATEEGVDAWRLPLKIAASRIEARHEERLYEAACVGSIFALKQRGWTDRESSGGASGVTVTVQVAAFGGQGQQVQVLTETTGPAETSVEDGD